MGKLAITGGKVLRGRRRLHGGRLRRRGKRRRWKDVLESTLWGGQPFLGKHAAAFAAKFAKVAYGEVRAVREHGDGGDPGGAEGDRDQAGRTK